MCTEVVTSVKETCLDYQLVHSLHTRLTGAAVKNVHKWTIVCLWKRVHPAFELFKVQTAGKYKQKLTIMSV